MQKILLTQGGAPEDPDCCRHAQEEEGRMTPTRCIHPPFVECYVIQTFSITSKLNPKLMPKVQDQIPMRKVCTLIQSLVLRHPNHHSSYSQDREKHHTLLTLIWSYNIVYDITNIEQQEPPGTNTSHPLPDVTLERPYPLAVVEGVQSRFFLTTSATGAIRHVCQACSVSPVVVGQCIPGELPGERELRVVQESWAWCPNPLGANLPQWPADPLLQRIWNGALHYPMI